MNTLNQKLPMLVLAIGFTVLLVAAWFVLFTGPGPTAVVPAGIVKSTVDSHFSLPQKSLPFAETTASGISSGEAYNNEIQAPYSGIATVPRAPQVQAVDPTEPGNHLSFNGKQISVVQALPSAEESGNELAVDVVPAQPQAPAAVAASGLTAEEEQFRAKWGWAMADQIKTAAIHDDTP